MPLLYILCNYLLLRSDGIANDSFTIVGVIGKIKLNWQVSHKELRTVKRQMTGNHIIIWRIVIESTDICFINR